MTSARQDAALVVGAGLAGITCARKLRRNGWTGAITVVGEEAQAVDRPPLSKDFLLDRVTPDRFTLLDTEAAADEGIDLQLGVRASRLDVSGSTVRTDSGDLHYGECVIATGARSRGLPGLPVGGIVHDLRSLADAIRLREALTEAQSLVVVGGGFIGLEVAAAARSRGIVVTVVEREKELLSRVLGDSAGRVVRELHTSRGVNVRCCASVSAVTMAGEARERVLVHLDDESAVPADIVLVAAGSVGNTEWLADSGLDVADGVLCDASGRTSVQHIWAIGDVAHWPNPLMGTAQRSQQWQCALDQAAVVANNIAGAAQLQEWRTVPYFWSDQYDVKLQFCGRPSTASVTVGTAKGPVEAFVDEGIIVGLLTLNQPRRLALGRRLISDQASIDEAIGQIAA